jgi:FKBP-type peptidyl-prolyl cis-trans isomerase FkpA
MKKTLLSILVCLATVAVSCGCKEEKSNDAVAVNETVVAKDINDLLLDENGKIDTLSYIVGMDIANSIEKNMIPMFKVDYDVMMTVLVQALNPNATIEIEGESFNKENFREIGDKYMSQELQGRIMAAHNDSTATIYTDDKEKNIVSAILGADIAYSATNVPFELEHRSLVTAINDIHNGKGRLTEEYAMEYTRNYFTVVIPQKNQKESEQWLAEIAKNRGVKKTESGILYKIEKTGDKKIKAVNDEDVVKVIYTGRTKDGKVFDSNRWSDMPKERQEMIKTYQPEQAEKDNPIEFPLNRVIKGWTEGMKLVGKGGKITLWIPAELAYGERGAGQDIGPNQALRFDVELLEVTSASAAE